MHFCVKFKYLEIDLIMVVKRPFFEMCWWVSQLTADWNVVVWFTVCGTQRPVWRGSCRFYVPYSCCVLCDWFSSSHVWGNRCCCCSGPSGRRWRFSSCCCFSSSSSGMLTHSCTDKYLINMCLFSMWCCPICCFVPVVIIRPKVWVFDCLSVWSPVTLQCCRHALIWLHIQVSKWDLCKEEFWLTALVHGDCVPG